MFTQKYVRQLSLVLSGALLFMLCATPNTFASSKEEKAAELAARVKADIAKLGTGPDARIAVKLRDKTKVAGFISQIGADSFVITDLKNGATTTVPYPSVTQAKGKNLSTGATIAIAVGIAVGVTLLVIILIAYAAD